MPDPKVEKLEAEIAALRDEFGAFGRMAVPAISDLQTGVSNVNGHIADVLREIGGVPDSEYRDPQRKTLRRRLHDLENDREAARIATLALNSAEKSRKAAEGQVFTRFQKVGLFLFAGVGCLIAVLNALGIT